MVRYRNVLGTLLVTAGCAQAKPSDAGSPPSGTGATGGAATSTNVEITPSDLGWVEGVDNELGLQGAWYPYGDQYGVAKCLNVGLHAPDECSHITSPDPPPSMGFPNSGGKMCTTGATAVVLACKPGVSTSGCPDHDFSNMWGAGIGFDFAAEKGPPEGNGKKSTWNPDEHGVVGISFELDMVPAAKLRVEFPMQLTADEASAVNLPPGSTTDDHPDGAPYWGADASFSGSPVVTSPEVNIVRWDAVKKPGKEATYAFDKSRLLGIQFHVPAVGAAPPGAYSFCVSKLTFLR
jgi:hypothetical protein